MLMVQIGNVVVPDRTADEGFEERPNRNFRLADQDEIDGRVVDEMEWMGAGSRAAHGDGQFRKQRFDMSRQFKRLQGIRKGKATDETYIRGTVNDGFRAYAGSGAEMVIAGKKGHFAEFPRVHAGGQIGEVAGKGDGAPPFLTYRKVEE